MTVYDAAYHDDLGNAVSISDDVIVAGAKHHDATADNAGAAYVFRRNGATGLWSLTQKLLADDGASGDELGKAVGVDGARSSARG